MRCVSFFFFSSRRRHTRYWRDWSSDVCSSDLKLNGEPVVVIGQQKGRDLKERQRRNFGSARAEGFRKALRLAKLAEKFRSEERRVGKECRSRWSQYHEKEKGRYKTTIQWRTPV